VIKDVLSLLIAALCQRRRGMLCAPFIVISPAPSMNAHTGVFFLLVKL
jgi:hypothetical protein